MFTWLFLLNVLLTYVYRLLQTVLSLKDALCTVRFDNVEYQVDIGLVKGGILLWFPAGQEIFLFKASGWTLGPIRPLTQWEPWALYSWLKQPGREADYSRPSGAEIKNDWSWIPFHQMCSYLEQRKLLVCFIVDNHGSILLVPLDHWGWRHCDTAPYPRIPECPQPHRGENLAQAWRCNRTVTVT